MHKLLTKEIEAVLPPLYSQEQVVDPMVLVKFFTQWSSWTWYVTEATREDDDVLMFGLVEGLETELGYFVLSELEALRGPHGLTIERDLYFTPQPLSAIRKAA